MNFKNFKIVRKIGNLSNKLKWFMFKGMQSYKIRSRYIDYLIPEPKNSAANQDAILENMVKEALAAEFSSSVKDLKSYNLLVDAVVHKLKKKQLEAVSGTEEI